METLPLFIVLLFLLVTVVTIWMFYQAARKNKILLFLLVALMAIQGSLAANGFFQVADSTPPRIIFAIAPSLLLIIIAFATSKGHQLIDRFDLEKYTYLHTIRVVVEFVLLSLFIHETLPQSMTFEGRNFDIISGLTAPFIAYYGFRKNRLGTRFLLIWNIVCLLLVLQVVTTGVLSVPSVIQQLSFDQPNVAVLYFPFIWLPGIVVPIVIFGHLVAIRRLTTSQASSTVQLS